MNDNTNLNLEDKVNQESTTTATAPSHDDLLKARKEAINDVNVVYIRIKNSAFYT